MPADKLLAALAANQNPVLDQIAVGLKVQNLICREVLPEVGHDQLFAQIPKHGKDAYVLVDDERAPNGPVPQVFTSPDTFVSVVLKEHTLKELIDKQKLIAVKSRPAAALSITSAKTRTLQARIELRKEYLASLLAIATGSYDTDHKTTLTGSNQWSHDSSKPRKEVNTRRKAIRDSIGVDPNRLMVPYDVHQRLLTHPDILTDFAYARDRQLTVEQLTAYFGVKKLVVGEAVTKNAKGTVTTSIWSDRVLLYYQAETPSMDEPTLGYTLRYTGPEIERVVTYVNEDQTGLVVKVADIYAHVLAMPEAGFLLDDVLA